MKIKYLFLIGIKNLMANKLRTFLTLGGVVVGISAIVFLVSLGFGLQRVVTSQVASLDEMRVFDVEYGESEIISIDDEVISKINEIENVKGVVPTINVASKIHYNSSAISGVVYGVEDKYLDMIRFSPREGERFVAGSNEAIINQAAINLLFSDQNKRESILGQDITVDYIITNDLLDSEDRKLIEGRKLTVVGIDGSTDTPYIYIPIDKLQEEGVNRYSSLKVEVNDQDKIDATREAIHNLGYRTSYIGDTVEQINQFFNIFKVVLGGFGGIAMVVASLGMFNTLTVSLLERIREVGLLKALGLKRKDIQILFLSEAIILGLGGGLIGLGLGYLIGVSLNVAMNVMASATNAISVEFFYIPWYFSIAIAFFSLIIGFVTGLYPARRAVKINALDALRYE